MTPSAKRLLLALRQSLAVSGALFVSSVLCLSPAHAALSGNFDVSRWVPVVDGGSIDTSGAPDSLVFVSSNAATGPSEQVLSIVVVETGTIRFDWSFETDDSSPTVDPFSVAINGELSQITDDFGDLAQTGSASFSVRAGDQFAFVASSFDSDFGAATTVIRGFDFLAAPTGVPTPATGPLAALGLLALARRRRAPRTGSD